ncbi:MAG: type II toxin-antitoxin system RelE/ParE family toxin [Oscillospiraceae bacterium]|jgi:phage-related protein|nr:type II toxin-antitoxin system RelE/ParE family toxin [Oscillospiraceae bacterium]
MYDVIFYSDAKGNEPIAEYILELRQSSFANKDARVNLNKIVAYLDLLCEYGTRVGEPVVKHLDDNIWELRPLRNRILFAHYKNRIFILLHRFVKKTEKTPKMEIEQAKRLLADYIERNDR